MQVVVADASLAALVVLGAVAGVAGAAALFVPAYLAYDIDADWLAGVFVALGVFESVSGNLVWTDTRILLLGLAVVVIVLTSILAAAARAVFSVALYHFAVDGAAVGPFAQGDLEGAVRRTQPWRL